MIRTLALSLFVGYTTTPLRRTSGLVLTGNSEVTRFASPRYRGVPIVCRVSCKIGRRGIELLADCRSVVRAMSSHLPNSPCVPPMFSGLPKP
jgi:hypothetical protein